MIVKSRKCVLYVLFFAAAFGNTNCYSQGWDTQYYYYFNFDENKKEVKRGYAKTALHTDIGKMTTKTDKDIISCSIEKRLESKVNDEMMRAKYQCEGDQVATIARKLDEDKAKVIYKVNTSGGKEFVEIVHAFTSYKPDSLPNLMEW